MKKIVLAFDSFKGSVGSFEIAKTAEKAIQEELPDCQIIRFPIADGGEGTTEALCSALHAQMVSCRVHDPFMKPIEVSYGIVNNGAMAIIEMASACGLPLIDSSRRNPMKTTTYGVGEMVADALKRGCREFIIGIGGSATNDAGIGMLKALGARFLDSGNGELEPVGENLIKVHQIDISQLNPALKESKFTIACDVSNPFFGEEGAAYVYAPQKGANSVASDRVGQWVAALCTGDKGIYKYGYIPASRCRSSRRNGRRLASISEYKIAIRNRSYIENASFRRGRPTGRPDTDRRGETGSPDWYGKGAGRNFTCR